MFQQLILSALEIHTLGLIVFSTANKKSLHHLNQQAKDTKEYSTITLTAPYWQERACYLLLLQAWAREDRGAAMSNMKKSQEGMQSTKCSGYSTTLHCLATVIFPSLFKSYEGWEMKHNCVMCPN